MIQKYILAIVLWSASASAHHSFPAEFDAKAPVILKGIVTKVEWINPHTWIYLRVENSKQTLWKVEAGSPNSLLRVIGSRNLLQVGTKVEVLGYQAHDKSCKPECLANARDLLMPGGKKFFVGSEGPGVPKEFPKISPQKN